MFHRSSGQTAGSLQVAVLLLLLLLLPLLLPPLPLLLLLLLLMRCLLPWHNSCEGKALARGSYGSAALSVRGRRGRHILTHPITHPDLKNHRLFYMLKGGFLCSRFCTQLKKSLSARSHELLPRKCTNLVFLAPIARNLIQDLSRAAARFYSRPVAQEITSGTFSIQLLLCRMRLRSPIGSKKHK